MVGDKEKMHQEVGQREQDQGKRIQMCENVIIKPVTLYANFKR